MASGLLNSIPQSYSETLPFQLLHQKNGATQEAFGYAVAGAGDVNGDGYDDFIIGNHKASPNGLFEAGSAYVYSGLDRAVIHQVDGDSIGDHFGYSVSGAGDVNGDGTADFIVGAVRASPNGIFWAGSVFVFSGADGSRLDRKDGSAPLDYFGSSVAGSGDVNNDGFDDFIIGATNTNPGGLVNAGSVFVYSGADSSLLYRKNGRSVSEFFGVSVAGAGDVNGDGYADFIAGAPYADPDTIVQSVNSGAAYVYSGFDGSALFTVKSDSADDYLGFSVSGAGDVNGDGRGDFIVGAPNTDAAGMADAGWAGIYSGLTGSLLHALPGDSAGDLFGHSVAGAGDVDGDGRDDVMVGAIGAIRNGFDYAGSARVISGVDGSMFFQIDGSGLLHEMGYAVATAGDVNGDGSPDVIAAAPLADSGRGQVFVYGLVSTDTPEERKNRPVRFELSQNYPNPFNPITTIRYFLLKREKVTLEIFNLAGRRVKVLAEGEQAAGEHVLSWDGKDAKGGAMSSGIYFYRLKGKDFQETRKMIFLK
ncbi:MAG TPA: FlgD immunoglobulin-like domain containing protein [candidate division Zixibacteria bacterium]|nr:FlgD immunoglobulin-like domain containing protein [candidate division Zixibacteria bacterium]